MLKAFGVAVAALLVASAAQAQSVSESSTRTRTTTTVERSGDTTTTTTRSRSTTTSVGASFDANAAVSALAGVIADQQYAPLRREAAPIRPQDGYGEWVVLGVGEGDCRMHFAERGFLGVRRVESTAGCPGWLSGVSHWRVDRGEVLLFRGATEEFGRLFFIRGELVGAGLTLVRPEQLQAQASDRAEP